LSSLSPPRHLRRAVDPDHTELFQPASSSLPGNPTASLCSSRRITALHESSHGISRRRRFTHLRRSSSSPPPEAVHPYGFLTVSFSLLKKKEKEDE
jgi:hypothetical protein